MNEEKSTHWYLCKIKYTKQVEDKQVKVSESHLIEAVNWYDAETKVFELFGANDNLKINAIGKTKYTKVSHHSISKHFFKVVIEDEDLEGKKINEHMLMNADDVPDLIKVIGKDDAGDATSIIRTNIKEVFHSDQE